MICILLAAAFALCLLTIGWYGSYVIFHPAKMLPNAVWPEQYGLAYARIDFKTGDGLTLKGWIIPAAKPTDQTVIVCHGWGDNKGDLLQYTHFLQEHFNLFYFDFRSHGESEGTIATLGCQERYDIQAAVEYLKRTRPAWAQHLGVFGFSMGTGPAAWATAQFDEIKGAVLETPMVSFHRAMKQWAWIKNRIPYFPVMMVVYWVCCWRLGESPEPYGPIHQVEKISPKPILVIAAEHDDIMLPAMVKEVFDKAREPKEFWLVPGAYHRHPQPVEASPIEYKKRLMEFFKKCL